jgi:HD-like signal output (HDOD) protein
MIRILFVDDEAPILDSLRNYLRKQRRDWEMVFALGGTAALAECEKKPFDVVVSDMRMPGMDGAMLLQRIKDEHPSTIRVVLSGHAERASIMSSLAVAHQYLSKPCDVETLRGVISRASAQRSIMSDPTLREVIGRLQTLPSVSTVYTELTRVLASETSSVEDVVGVVERDPAMCLKLLQIVNSAFFGLPRKVKVMREAIAYLGTERVRALTLVSKVFADADATPGVDSSLLSLIQRRSMLVASVARELAPVCAEDAFMGGMLHDVGQIVLMLGDTERYASLRKDALVANLPIHRVERERLGVTHAEVGAYVLGAWGVPLAIGSAVAGHHEPARYAGASLDAVTAVHVADALADEVDTPAAAHGTLDEAHLAQIGMLGELPAWRGLVKRLHAGAA